MRFTMITRRSIAFLCLTYLTLSSAELYGLNKLRSYAKYFDWNTFGNSSENELWKGLIRDCSRKMSFSCIQKNAYTYLDNTFIELDNITVFDGFVLTKNNLDYDSMSRQSTISTDVAENLIEASDEQKRSESSKQGDDRPEARIEPEEEAPEQEEYKTPLEEITSALRNKTVKFLSTRDYELQLPDFIFEGSTIKISPREIDDNGALFRVDFGQRGLQSEGRIFKKIKKFIQNKLLMAFFALILIIKLIKVKFLFVIPFLFGIGAAKKLFLKLLLFLVPAFAHVFKLCSSYYSNKANRFHHHHHQIAHHHHHVPVPVPVPTYYAPNHHHHQPHHGEEHEGYEYSHPHIQLRKDIEELKEWGIKPMDEPFDELEVDHAALPSVYPGNSFAAPPHGPASRSPAGFPFHDKYPGPVQSHAQSLAYSGYVDEYAKLNRRIAPQFPITGTTVAQVSQVPPGPINIQLPATSSVNVVASNLPTATVRTISKTPYPVYPQPQKSNVPQQVLDHHVTGPVQQGHGQRVAPQIQIRGNNPTSISSPGVHHSNNAAAYDDPFYGPILERLDDIFAQLRFAEENCRERLICSMYKNPTQYSPHSNLVSNELSRDPQELKHGGTGSNSSHRFNRYVNAARLGQEGGDCLRTYPCQINTE
ncbi:uncharacterized protein Osi17 [Venturia canescens]|uniref:uncharacterized protein Osi17 n=1 Tax=Venturia canescens TaxID=32260 RepID=UPI001C9D2C6A|nr:uncharacterized protein LOC122405907 [Venturia canescens]